jgi:hypothetical protein
LSQVETHLKKPSSYKRNLKATFWLPKWIRYNWELKHSWF